jgi:hypothetical protein
MGTSLRGLHNGVDPAVRHHQLQGIAPLHLLHGAHQLSIGVVHQRKAPLQQALGGDCLQELDALLELLTGACQELAGMQQQQSGSIALEAQAFPLQAVAQALPEKCALLLQVQRQVLAVGKQRNHSRGRGGSAIVGHQVGDGGVVFMAQACDQGEWAGRKIAGKSFVVEDS